jgi:ketosteroid isomerase-like protein
MILESLDRLAFPWRKPAQRQPRADLSLIDTEQGEASIGVSLRTFGERRSLCPGAGCYRRLREIPQQVVRRQTILKPPRKKQLKMRFALALVALAISFALPIFAQQTNTPDPRIVQQRDLIGVPEALAEFSVLWMKEDEAYNSNDASALAALFTEDAVLVVPDGMFFGRLAIEKRYSEAFQQWPITTFSSQRYGLNAIDNAAWSVGERFSTLESKTGPVFAGGYESVIYVREGAAWKIRMLTLTERPRLAPPAETK